MTLRELPPNVQRVWFLLLGGELSCVGVILDGAVQDMTAPDAQGFRGALCYAQRTGDTRERITPDGRKFFVTPQEFVAHRMVESDTGPCGSLEQIMAIMDTIRDDMLSKGWIAIDFDPINDPD